MARTLTAAMQTAIAPPATAPRYLVEIETSPGLYYTTGPAVTWGGRLWASIGVEVQQVTADQATISAPNHDQSFTALVLGSDLRDTAVTIWSYYGDSPAAADPAVVFAGVIDSAEIGDFCRIACVADGSGVAFAPRLSLALFFGADLVAPGTGIEWDGGRGILRGQHD